MTFFCEVGQGQDSQPSKRWLRPLAAGLQPAECFRTRLPRHPDGILPSVWWYVLELGLKLAHRLELTTFSFRSVRRSAWQLCRPDCSVPGRLRSAADGIRRTPERRRLRSWSTATQCPVAPGSSGTELQQRLRRIPGLDVRNGLGGKPERIALRVG